MSDWVRHYRATFARPGVLIMERHKQARPRRIVEFHSGSHVIAESLDTGRRTRISWKTLFRYDCIARPKERSAA